ncbi:MULTISPECIES: magnesium chelatase ATPase subunit D [unclassified Synechococcus]|uniref:magnesium chelatase ATPase subunit D n=1 Tax=unclassified Synechococcus TaxID=2626047 RepID=UPI0020CC0863|nr:MULTISPECIES: magnesium chelatase ATPase subunit D [unclassified Synechococcus]MCP9824488.1 magnesium chelatase ATPase subunit D [Synechococcus sp. EJ6-Ellesmere]
MFPQAGPCSAASPCAVPRHAFPLNAVVGQASIRTALLLLAVDPGLGGIVIAGRRGTAKSVLARALHALLPPIRVIRRSCCNADPSAPGNWDDATIAHRATISRTPVSALVPAPFVQVPLGVTEDRLLGSVDVSASIRRGRAVFQPGLLAEAHRGVLYVDELNLLDPGIANLLFTVVDGGFNQVEREGISFRHPCRPLLIATYNPAEGELRAHLIDRLAMVLSADTPLELDERVEAVARVLQHAADPQAFWRHFGPGLEELQRRIAAGRRLLPRVCLAQQQLRYLVEEAIRAGVEGHRADLFAARVARAHASLQGRRLVDAGDLRLAVELVILPRSAAVAATPEAAPEPPPPAAPPGDSGSETPPEQEVPPPEPATGEPISEAIPDTYLFSPEGVLLDPHLLAQAARGKRRHGKAGGGGLVRSLDRGRYVKPLIPHGPIHHVAIDATLRAAAPHQRARRRAILGNSRRGGREWHGPKLLLREDDLRVKQLVRKAGALVIFVVDASGSMALNRMQAAKGAALQLLSEAYRSRDQVALITFRGRRAEVQLPPTRSITAASRRLERLPCGGGSPLAHGLAQAVRLGENARRSKDVGEILIVLISDGNANVSLSRSLASAADHGPGGEGPEPMGLEGMRQEVLGIAAAIRRLGMELLVIDTGTRHRDSSLGADLARHGGGRHQRLPRASQREIAATTRGLLGHRAVAANAAAVA